MNEEIREKIIEMTKKLGFYGIDASSDISLFEYGLLGREITEYQCSIIPAKYFQLIHVIDWQEYENPLCYDISTYSEDEIKELINEDWFNKKSFFSFIGMDESEWLKIDAVSKIYDMISYTGNENIFGTSYHTKNDSELLEWLQNEEERQENSLIK
jgi:hypothetical protein